MNEIIAVVLLGVFLSAIVFLLKLKLAKRQEFEACNKHRNLNMYLNPQEIEGFLNGELTLDCPKMELIPRDESKTAFSGSGSITLTPDKQFQLKFFSTASLEIKELLESINWVPGEIISDDHYYDLVAHDISERVWNASRFLPRKNTSSAGTVIKATIPEIMQQADNPFDDEYQSLVYYIRGNLDFPFNKSVMTAETVDSEVRNSNAGWSLAKFTVCSIKFEVQHVGKNTRIKASSAVIPLNRVVANRIFETLCFVIGFPGNWNMQSLTSNDEVKIRLRADEEDVVRSQIPRPLQYQGKNPVDELQLFACYLEHILKDSDSRVHPVSVLHSSILQSGRSSLQVQALTLSVVIEPLLKEHFKEIYKLDDELGKQIEAVNSFVNDVKRFSSKFKERLTGMLSSMKKPRAKDILIPLCDTCNIDQALVKTYGKLRNKSAHCYNASGGDTQNYLNQIHTVLVLYYHLVFLLIGYQGAYTEYGQYGYPTHKFTGKIP